MTTESDDSALQLPPVQTNSAPGSVAPPDPPRARQRLRLRPDARRYLFGATVMGVSFTFPFTLLALYLDKMGLSKSQVGFVVSGQPWGQVLAAAPAAILLARYSTRSVLALSAIVSGVLYALLPWAPGIHGLFAINLAAGLAWSLHFTAGAPFLFRHSDNASRPLLFSVVEASRMLGSVFGAAIAGLLAIWLSERLGDEIRGHAWALSTAGAFPALAVFLYLRIEEKNLPAEHHAPIWPALRKHHGLVVRFVAPQFLISIGSGMTIPFMSLYFSERFHFSSKGIGYLFASGQVLMALGFLSGPFLMATLGPVRAMMAVQLASIPFFFVLARAELAWLAAGAYLLRTAFMNASHPVLKTFLMEASPPGLRELQNALLLSLWGIGWIVGPLIGGAVLDTTNNDYALLMYTTIALYLAASATMHMTLRPVEKLLERR